MKIVCATDFSDAAAPAEQQALALAAALSAELVIVHVLTDAPLYREGVPWALDLRGIYDEMRQWVQTTLDRRTEAATAKGVTARAVVRTGVPYTEICKVADEAGAGMIVLGTHGRSGLDRLLLGSVAERVVRTARCPVLLVGPNAAPAA